MIEEQNAQLSQVRNAGAQRKVGAGERCAPLRKK